MTPTPAVGWPDPATDPVVRFARLFQGRRDIQGVERGGCLHRSVNAGHYRGHLQGRFGVGIYPLLPSGRCHWAAVDIDNGDLDATLLLRRLLADAGLPAVVFTSREKGYHAIVFFAEWVDAALALRVLRFYAMEAGLPPGVEIYPRPDRPSADSIAPGGYLRLPYLGALAEPGAKHRAEPGRRVALHPEDPARTLSLAPFLDVAEAGLVREDLLRRVAEGLEDECSGGLQHDGASDNRHGAVGALPADPPALGVSPVIADLIAHGWQPGGRYPSRSEAQQAVTSALVAAGHDDAIIHRVLTDPRWRISERALERQSGRRQDMVRRSIAAARRRVVIVPGTAAGSLTPTMHRQLLAHRAPPLAWPVLAELLSSVNRSTGLSFATARSIARALGIAVSNVYDRGLRPLLASGVVETVPLERPRGRWGRVAFRVVTPPRATGLLKGTSRSESRAPGESVRRGEGVLSGGHGAEVADSSDGRHSTVSSPADTVAGARP